MIIAPPSVPPAPSAEIETKLVETLRNLDPLLGVMWVTHAAWNATQQRYEGRYALTCRWPSIDKRWQEVQQGKMSETDAVDIIGWLCEDMQDASSVPTSFDGITDRVMALLGSMNNEQHPWKERMEATVRHNASVFTTLKKDAGDQANRMAEHLYRQAKNIPQVNGANFDSQGNLLQ